MTKNLFWHTCTWFQEPSRPTEPGLYRLLIKGFDDVPDYQTWGSLILTQDYKESDSTDWFADKVPDGEPYLAMFPERHYEEAEDIIAWYGPVVVPDRSTWTPTEEEKVETLPQMEGLYRVLIVGDSEYEGPHCYYDYPDYEIWAEVKSVGADGPDIRCEFDEEPDWIVSWYGPIFIPEVDCYS